MVFRFLFSNIIWRIFKYLDADLRLWCPVFYF